MAHRAAHESPVHVQTYNNPLALLMDFRALLMMIVEGFFRVRRDYGENGEGFFRECRAFLVGPLYRVAGLGAQYPVQAGRLLRCARPEFAVVGHVSG